MDFFSCVSFGNDNYYIKASDKASDGSLYPGETYEVSVRIGDRVVVASKDGRTIKFAAPEFVFIDKEGGVHIVYPDLVFTGQDILTDKDGRMIRR